MALLDISKPCCMTTLELVFTQNGWPLYHQRCSAGSRSSSLSRSVSELCILAAFLTNRGLRSLSSSLAMLNSKCLCGGSLTHGRSGMNGVPKLSCLCQPFQCRRRWDRHPIQTTQFTGVPRCRPMMKKGGGQVECPESRSARRVCIIRVGSVVGLGFDFSGVSMFDWILCFRIRTAFAFNFAVSPILSTTSQAHIDRLAEVLNTGHKVHGANLCILLCRQTLETESHIGS